MGAAGALHGDLDLLAVGFLFGEDLLSGAEWRPALESLYSLATGDSLAVVIEPRKEYIGTGTLFCVTLPVESA